MYGEHIGIANNVISSENGHPVRESKRATSSYQGITEFGLEFGLGYPQFLVEKNIYGTFSTSISSTSSDCKKIKHIQQRQQQTESARLEIEETSSTNQFLKTKCILE